MAMSTDQQLATDISRQGERLAAQLAEFRRDLQARKHSDGQALVQSATEAIEQLLRDLHLASR